MSMISSLLGLCSVIVHLHLNRYPCCTDPVASKAAEAGNKQGLFPALRIGEGSEDFSEAVVNIKRCFVGYFRIDQTAIQF